jgi:hypothetical protein
MSSLKTRPNITSVSEFLDKVTPESKKFDGHKLVDIFNEVTGMPPILWGPSIIGYGTYSYSYSSGKTMEWFPVGFSPRKQAISIHLMISHEELEEELGQLGKHKLGKGCIYINKLADIDEQVLRKMISKAFKKHLP